MGPRGRFYPYLYILHILDCLGQDMQVLYLGRAPHTKETLPDFLKWRRVTRPPLVFRGLTGSQRTPGFWGVTLPAHLSRVLKMFLKHTENSELKELSECTFSFRQHFQYISK